MYEHGTHFVLPESLLRKALPVGLKFVLRFVFKAAKDYPKECEATRKDIGHSEIVDHSDPSFVKFIYNYH